MRSMTGFGQAVRAAAGYRLQVDVRSVNHRHLELNVRVPREWPFLEDPLRKAVHAVARRGKIDVTLTAERERTETVEWQVNWPLADAYVRASEQIGERYGLQERLSLRDLVALPDVVLLKDDPGDDRDALIREAVLCAEDALAQLAAMREGEGRHLRNDLAARLAALRDLRAQAVSLATQTVEQYWVRLRQRIADLLAGEAAIDEQRLATEVAIFADRCDISEELTRLESHFSQFAHLIDSDEPVGRKLDFLLQEMNREVNTVGSKASDARVAALVVEMKAELEKMREQVQNIE